MNESLIRTAFEQPPADPDTLVDLLDRVLDVGVVVNGELTISVADVDLLYVGLKVLLCSPDKLKELAPERRAA